MAIALDGTPGATYAGSGTSGTVNVTTTTSGKIFVAITRNGGNPVTSVTGASLTFTQHAANAVNNGIELWVATSGAAQSNITLTVTFPSNATFFTFHAFGVKEENGFDTDATIPTVVTSGAATINIDATNSMAVGAARMTSVANPAAGSGFTRILGGTGDGFQLTQYATYTSAQTNLSVNTATGEANNGNIATALAEAAAAGRYAHRQILLGVG